MKVNADGLIHGFARRAKRLWYTRGMNGGSRIIDFHADRATQPEGEDHILPLEREAIVPDAYDPPPPIRPRDSRPLQRLPPVRSGSAGACGRFSPPPDPR